MRRIARLLVFLCVLLIPVLVLAQGVKIIDIQGDVTVKIKTLSSWQKAKLDMSLNKNSELKTGAASFCTLAFDSEKKNIVSVKENSQIKINSIMPAEVYLPQGRVFSLVKNLKKGEKFQIRTPAAIAGARGSGWITGYQTGSASASCLDDTIFVTGLDASGNPTGEQELGSGFGIDVADGGLFGQSFSVGDTDRQEWDNFNQYFSGLNAGGNTGEGQEGDDLMGDLPGPGESLREEGKQDFSDIGGEERRIEEEVGNVVTEPEPEPVDNRNDNTSGGDEPGSLGLDVGPR